jgi:YggT family protein
MISLFLQIVEGAVWLFTLIVVADVVLSYFISPYHPARIFLDRIVQPFLRPIQRLLPPMMGFDLSPLILLLLVSLLRSIIIGLFSGVR